MIFDEKDRQAKVYIGAKQVRGKTSAESFKAMLDMNDAVLKICISSIRSRKPDISEKELLKELKDIYRKK
nr:hypothetical protein [Nanoarchaeum sp.]